MNRHAARIATAFITGGIVLASMRTAETNSPWWFLATVLLAFLSGLLMDVGVKR